MLGNGILWVYVLVIGIKLDGLIGLISIWMKILLFFSGFIFLYLICNMFFGLLNLWNWMCFLCKIDVFF